MGKLFDDLKTFVQLHLMYELGLVQSRRRELERQQKRKRWARARISKQQEKEVNMPDCYRTPFPIMCVLPATARDFVKTYVTANEKALFKRWFRMSTTEFVGLM